MQVDPAAQVIAIYDYLKSEMPDVFFVQNDPNYPINFTGLSFSPPNSPPLVLYGAYMLPLGHMVQGPRVAGGVWAEGYGDSHVQGTSEPNPGYLYSSHPELGFTGTGIMGASYTAAAGLYKNLGYLPAGYDGVDNNNNGLIDDWAEGVNNPPLYNTANATALATVQANLAAHKHITARAEMLYAILVEGAGPLGSVFNRDDFTDKEVKDTDGDGLPEFVDAWGQPLQFFRWPLLYHSDIQRGQAFVAATSQSWNLVPPYATRTPLSQNGLEQREQDPIDSNQQLLSPGWWSTGAGGLAANGSCPFSLPAGVPAPVPSGVSAAAMVFGMLFHRLTEPLPLAGVYDGNPVDWDRSGTTSRRAFYTKVLVLSGGPDGVPGVFLYPDSYLSPPPAIPNADIISAHLIANENIAMPFGWGTSGLLDVDFIGNATIGISAVSGGPSLDPTHPSSYDLFNAAQDDITNQNLQAVGGVGGSG